MNAEIIVHALFAALGIVSAIATIVGAASPNTKVGAIARKIGVDAKGLSSREVAIEQLVGEALELEQKSTLETIVEELEQHPELVGRLLAAIGRN